MLWSLRFSVSFFVRPTYLKNSRLVHQRQRASSRCRVSLVVLSPIIHPWHVVISGLQSCRNIVPNAHNSTAIITILFAGPERSQPENSYRFCCPYQGKSTTHFFHDNAVSVFTHGRRVGPTRPGKKESLDLCGCFLCPALPWRCLSGL